MNGITGIIQRNRAGEAEGLYSVCSAHEAVIEAALRQARRDGRLACIEATLNQVNQNGGYTGMKPADFHRFVMNLAEKADFPPGQVLLGGDHLGPGVWTDEPAERAMGEAVALVHDYVSAGFSKIHLDASMGCADEGELPTKVVAERTAVLCRSAEDAFDHAGRNDDRPVYVIGTDVPTPGGARDHEEHVSITPPREVEETVQECMRAFQDHGLERAWERVIAVVVQPGVEFGDDQVFAYDEKAAKPLSEAILSHDGLAYEAHSTDYQTRESLAQMVRDHFAILKVGPELTFVYREALFALEQIERELPGPQKPTEPSRLSETMKALMLAEPAAWKAHFHGAPEELDRFLKYSYSDRIRYYWSRKQARASVARLFANLGGARISLGLLSQYLPVQYHQVREGALSLDPEALALSKISECTSKYAAAVTSRRK